MSLKGIHFKGNLPLKHAKQICILEGVNPSTMEQLILISSFLGKTLIELLYNISPWRIHLMEMMQSLREIIFSRLR